MLYTNLKHIESAIELSKIVGENENVVVVCGRMGPMCVPVYRIAEKLDSEYDRVMFYDMEFDDPESGAIRTLPETEGFLNVPFVVYYKNGNVVKATSGLQTQDQITNILDHEFAESVNA